MDLIYFDNRYDQREEFKESFASAFPENKMENVDDNIHGARVAIFYEPVEKGAMMKWLIKEGWAKCSLHFNLMAMEGKDGEGYKKLKEWIKEISV